ncbi:hypothetical protein J3F83DRAFT_738831 [Trichoderma novae-zelandiae]
MYYDKPWRNTLTRGRGFQRMRAGHTRDTQHPSLQSHAFLHESTAGPSDPLPKDEDESTTEDAIDNFVRQRPSSAAANLGRLTGAAKPPAGGRPYYLHMSPTECICELWLFSPGLTMAAIINASLPRYLPYAQDSMEERRIFALQQRLTRPLACEVNSAASEAWKIQSLGCARLSALAFSHAVGLKSCTVLLWCNREPSERAHDQESRTKLLESSSQLQCRRYQVRVRVPV